MALMPLYDIAQICLNGHVVNKSKGLYPVHSKDYCAKCGAATISECQHCKAGVQGQYYPGESFHIPDYSRPAFCHNCGKPYPWTGAKLQAARELTEELEGLSGEEKEILTGSFDDIVITTPSTEVATTRFKKLMKKATGEAVPAMRALIVDIASETAKKLIQG